MVVITSDNNRYSVLVQNNSNQFLQLYKNFPIARMSLKDNDLSLFSMHYISDNNHKTIHYQANKPIIKTNFNYNINKLYMMLTEYNVDDEDVNCNTNRNSNPFESNDLDNVAPDADHPNYLTAKTLDEIESKQEKKRFDQALAEATELINNDEGFNEAEKKDAIETFKKERFVSKSCTNLINNNMKLTELKLKKGEAEPIPIQDILSQLKLYHLSDENKMKAMKLFEEFSDVFTRHEWDIPVNTFKVVGDIQLKDHFDENEIANTKLIPIPAHAKEGVQKILDNMEKHGILECSYTYSPFIQNLLLGKKNQANPGYSLIHVRRIIGLKDCPQK